jgi:hypothetical protein
VARPFGQQREDRRGVEDRIAQTSAAASRCRSSVSSATRLAVSGT